MDFLGFLSLSSRANYFKTRDYSILFGFTFNCGRGKVRALGHISDTKGLQANVIVGIVARLKSLSKLSKSYFQLKASNCDRNVSL